MAQLGKNGKKSARGKRKREGKTKPISLFVRNKISFETYLKMVSKR